MQVLGCVGKWVCKAADHADPAVLRCRAALQPEQWCAGAVLRCWLAHIPHSCTHWVHRFALEGELLAAGEADCWHRQPTARGRQSAGKGGRLGARLARAGGPCKAAAGLAGIAFQRYRTDKQAPGAAIATSTCRCSHRHPGRAGRAAPAQPVAPPSHRCTALHPRHTWPA